MELLILIIIAIVLCLILDVSVNVIILGLIALIGIISGLFALAFLGCNICLLRTKKKEAFFSRIGPVEGSKFQVAYYRVEEKEYPCAFPKEFILEKSLYQTDKMYHVLLHEKWGKVFDRFAIITCILGLFAGTALSVWVLYYFMS